MPSIMNVAGEQIDMIRPVLEASVPGSADVLGLARDLIIVRLRKRRIPWRAIGKILGMSHTGVRKRYQAIPEHARQYYETVSWLE